MRFLRRAATPVTGVRVSFVSAAARPRLRGTLARFGTILLLLVPLAVSSTPPLPPPVRQFDVRGTIVRSGGGSLSDHAITLLWSRRPCASEWLRFPGAAALTREDGSFSVTGKAFDYSESVCSLVVAVVFPDTLLLGTPFDEGEPYHTEEDTRSSTEDGFLCNETHHTKFVTGYFYFQDDVVVTIP